MYKDVAKNLNSFRIKTPPTDMPMPEENDYNAGFINRYFLRKSNDINSPIFEVSSNVWEEYSDNPFWIGTNIRWRITGTTEEIMKSNEAAIVYVNKKFPTLSLYLPNILQFKRD